MKNKVKITFNKNETWLEIITHHSYNFLINLENLLKSHNILYNNKDTTINCGKFLSKIKLYELNGIPISQEKAKELLRSICSILVC